jgi:hypothetical protein
MRGTLMRGVKKLVPLVRGEPIMRALSARGVDAECEASVERGVDPAERGVALDRGVAPPERGVSMVRVLTPWNVSGGALWESEPSLPACDGPSRLRRRVEAAATSL